MISPQTALLVSIRTEFSVLNPKPFPLCHMPSCGIRRDLTCQLPNSMWRKKMAIEWAAWIRAGLAQESFEGPGKKRGSEKAAFVRADRWPLEGTGRKSDLPLFTGGVALTRWRAGFWLTVKGVTVHWGGESAAPEVGGDWSLCVRSQEAERN